MAQLRRKYNPGSPRNAQFAGRTAVYRLFDKYDCLLYVGIARWPDQRWNQHKRDKLWWHYVARKEVAWYETRREAMIVEETAEREESPRYSGLRRMRTWRTEPMVAPELEAEIAAVAEKLAAQIDQGVYVPGESLPQGTRLGNSLGVSIAMAHSALSQLENRGLVELRGPHGRYRVRDDFVSSAVSSPPQVTELPIQKSPEPAPASQTVTVPVDRPGEAAALLLESMSPAQVAALVAALSGPVVRSA